jgi:hypothetical protein
VHPLYFILLKRIVNCIEHFSGIGLWSTDLHNKVTYGQQSVDQSVLVSGPHLWLATNFPCSLRCSLDSCYFVAPSLMRGRSSAVTLCLPSLTRGEVCLLSFSVYSQYVHKIFTLSVFDTGLLQLRLDTADYALVTSSLHYHDSPRHLNSRTHDRCQV